MRRAPRGCGGQRRPAADRRGRTMPSTCSSPRSRRSSSRARRRSIRTSAVVLAITPDHLDWHGSYDALRRRQGADRPRAKPADDLLVFDADDADASAIAWPRRARAVVGFSPRSRRGRQRARGRRPVGCRRRRARCAPVAGMRRALVHDRTNALAAAIAALAVGATRPGSAPRWRRTRPSPTAWRWSAKLVGCSGTTIPRRRTRRERCARSSRSTRSCCSRAAATRASISACSRRRADRLRGVVAFGEAGARSRRGVRGPSRPS